MKKTVKINIKYDNAIKKFAKKGIGKNKTIHPTIKFLTWFKILIEKESSAICGCSSPSSVAKIVIIRVTINKINEMILIFFENPNPNLTR